jgi:hypothetical protein
MAGYSGTPLIKKLGIKPGHCVTFIGAPKDYAATLGKLPPEVLVSRRPNGTLDFIQLFVRDRSELQSELPRAQRALAPDGMLWVSWPKKASGIATDLNENIIRDFALASGLVDVKVCAVDETWSGLKLVYRLRDRKKV